MKRFIALILSGVLALSIAVMPAAAAGAANQDEMLSVMAILSVLNGDEKGNLNLSSPVTRAQFSKMAVNLSQYRDLAASNTGISPFSDVSSQHWAASYITLSRDLGWIYGFLDGTFRPDNSVSYAQAVTVVLRMLGYPDSYFTGTWPTGQMTVARSLGLDRNITASDNSSLTRLQCAWLLYNALSAKTQSGLPYAQTLGYALDTSGNVSYLALVSAKLDGPVMAAGPDWTDSIGFVPDKIYVNDIAAAAYTPAPYDVIYYIKSVSTAWVYNIKRTGTLDAVLPSKSAPASIVVSGVTYPLGSAAASVAVSSSGTVSVGDAVTLLIGRDGAAAHVMKAADLSAAVYGIVTGSGTATYPTASGGYYSSKYVDILGADGVTYRFATTRDFSEGAIVKAGMDTAGVSVTRVSSGSLSGKVNAAATAIGSTKLASDADILDVYGEKGVSVSSARLAGATLTSGDVLFYSLNGNGEIQTLILSDVTGDNHQYGLLTEVSKQSLGPMSFVTYYSALINGAPLDFALSSTSAGAVKNSCVELRVGSTGFDAVGSLSSAVLTSLGQLSATTATGQTLPLHPNAQYYIQRGDAFTYVSADQVSAGSYTLYGWYDNRPAGQIRVIIAR